MVASIGADMRQNIGHNAQIPSGGARVVCAVHRARIYALRRMVLPAGRRMVG
ncbi:hypothetical protein [Mycobacterium sp. E2699]|uniref:hypothetical protein n=1 Tax=Mycobacterium sp. E2699 TaxID=1834137 RepID=UPI0012EA8C5A|nr:hypothetical protein [Mycobacterium sp. E2699]